MTRHAFHVKARSEYDARAQRMAKCADQNPDLTQSQLAERFGVPAHLVRRVLEDPRWWPTEGQAVLARAPRKARGCAARIS